MLNDSNSLSTLTIGEVEIRLPLAETAGLGLGVARRVREELDEVVAEGNAADLALDGRRPVGRRCREELGGEEVVVRALGEVDAKPPVIVDRVRHDAIPNPFGDLDSMTAVVGDRVAWAELAVARDRDEYSGSAVSEVGRLLRHVGADEVASDDGIEGVVRDQNARASFPRCLNDHVRDVVVHQVEFAWSHFVADDGAARAPDVHADVSTITVARLVEAHCVALDPVVGAGIVDLHAERLEIPDSVALLAFPTSTDLVARSRLRALSPHDDARVHG